MPRGVKKENLPSKVCVVCNRPFTWRKKWEKVWEEVTTCSKSCNSARRSLKTATNKAEVETKPAETPQRSEKDDEDSELRGSERGVVGYVGGGGRNFGNDEWDVSTDNSAVESEAGEDARMVRKAAKKAVKAERRDKREGRAGPTVGQKPCELCSLGSDLLVRCRTDASQEWRLVCGKCWGGVSGGVPDGDAKHPHYRYGGLWKNRVVKEKGNSGAASAAEEKAEVLSLLGAV
eukprot:CAMPEP_0171627070 /NCGR_PEP_ID=MMETSP0990-20121206/20510_1 /TAXON_ID=483369 /ORGANISM="non described non described, Strain CCMP2098" /LENGTH=232 /DNA_ID=CAMNT_0012194769 /DNA_START=240 /DNA_END=938 /DNA_ORIENTATION=+